MIDEKDFRSREAYFLEIEDKKYSFQLFKSMTKTRLGLCISKEHPDNIKERYSLSGVDFGWLSDSDHPSSIGSNELELLGLTIKRFISEEEGIILLDGLDFLFSNNTAQRVIKLISSLYNEISKYSSILLIVLDASELNRKNLDLLKANLDFEVKELGLTHGERQKLSGSPGKKNLVLEVREMMDFLEEQEQNLEKEVDQIEKVSSLDNLKEIQEALKDLREENRELKEELKKIKKQDEIKSRDEKAVNGNIAKEVLSTIDDEKEGVRKEFEKIESTEEKEEPQKEKSMDLMETLMDLKNEVKSLRTDVNEIKSDTTYDEKGGPKIEGKEKEELKESTLEEKVIEEGEFKDDFAISEESVEAKGQSEFIEIKPGSVVDEDLFSERNIKVGSESRINGSLEAENDVILEHEAVVEGDITSRSGEVKIGRDCKVNGGVFGKSVFIASGSEVKNIKADREVDLEEKTKVGNITCQNDINISKNVDIEGEIYYGGNLNLEVPDMSIKKKAHPMGEMKEEKQEEREEEESEEEKIVEERWASE